MSSFLDQRPQDLNRFIDTELQPDDSFLSECARNMDYLAEYLKTQTNFHVAETIKGGSLGKGTALKGRSDLDVVLFLARRFQNVDQLKRDIESVTEELKGEVLNWIRSNPGRIVMDETTSHGLKIKISYKKGADSIDVDLLPTKDLLREMGKRATYQAMARDEDNRGHYSSSLVSLQLEFVRKQNPNVKNLIRLVKYWRKTMFEERSYGPKLPTSYVFELLCIHAWEKAGSPPRFDTAKAFKSILQILKDNQNINAFWQDNYRMGEYSGMAQRQYGKPFILDPANPFNNVCDRFDAWPEISTVADQTLKRPLVRDVALIRRGYGNHDYSWN